MVVWSIGFCSSYTQTGLDSIHLISSGILQRNIKNSSMKLLKNHFFKKEHLLFKAWDPICFDKCHSSKDRFIIGHHQYLQINRFSLNDIMLHDLFKECKFLQRVKVATILKEAFTQSTQMWILFWNSYQSDHCYHQVRFLNHQQQFWTCRFFSNHQILRECK